MGGGVTLTTVQGGIYWRVKMAWLDHTPRYFGKFDSQAQAEKWIAEHRSLAKQHQELEPDQAPPDSERVIK